MICMEMEGMHSYKVTTRVLVQQLHSEDLLVELQRRFRILTMGTLLVRAKNLQAMDSYLDPKHGVVELCIWNQPKVSSRQGGFEYMTYAEAFGTLNSRHDAGCRKVTLRDAVGSVRKRSRQSENRSEHKNVLEVMGKRMRVLYSRARIGSGIMSSIRLTIKRHSANGRICLTCARAISSATFREGIELNSARWRGGAGSDL